MNRYCGRPWSGPARQAIHFLISLGAFFVPTLSLIPTISAQEPIFKANTREVSVVFRVVDKNNRPVPGVTRDEIRVEDEGTQRSLTSFAGDVAYAQVVIAADVSGSMSTVLEPLEAALSNFADRISEDSDRQPGDVLLSLLPFSDTGRMLVDRTPDIAEFKQAVAHLRPSGSTALVDAILSTLLNAFGDKEPSAVRHPKESIKDDGSPIPSEFRRKPARVSTRMPNRPKFLVVFTDAGENSSTHQWSDIASALLGREVVIYSVLFDSGTPDSNVPKLSSITEESGGKVYKSRADDLKRIYEQIAKDIRNRYLLTFSASDVENPRIWRKIRVSTTRPGLSIFARTGYCPESPCQNAEGAFIGGQPKNWNEVLALNRDPQVVSAVRQHLQGLRFEYSHESEKMIADLRDHPILIEKHWSSTKNKDDKATFVVHPVTDKSHLVNVDTEVCGVAVAPDGGSRTGRNLMTDSSEDALTAKASLTVLNPEIRVAPRAGSAQQTSSDTYFQSQALFYLTDPSARVTSKLRVQCNRPHFLVSDEIVQLAVDSLEHGLKLKVDGSTSSTGVGPGK